jgi:hypothetical protein
MMGTRLLVPENDHLFSYTTPWEKIFTVRYISMNFGTK